MCSIQHIAMNFMIINARKKVVYFRYSSNYDESSFCYVLLKNVHFMLIDMQRDEYINNLYI